MASNGVDATYGFPKFPETDAPALGADLEEVADYARKRGTRFIGTTAERTAFAYPYEGLRWYDTDLEAEYVYDGSAWVGFGTLYVGWTNLTAASGFTTGTPTPQYTIRNGVVYLRGQITKNSGNVADGDILCNVPAAARPPESVTRPVSGGSGASSMRGFVATGGDLSVHAPKSGSSTYVTIDGLQWIL